MASKVYGYLTIYVWLWVSSDSFHVLELFLVIYIFLKNSQITVDVSIFKSVHFIFLTNLHLSSYVTLCR